MRILVLAYYTSGSAYEGGSSRTMKCMADTLTSMGHDVVLSNNPSQHVNEVYDLLLCSHYLHIIDGNPSFKVCIAHGVVPDENLYPGADRYISISQEIKKHNLKAGMFSEVIPQPVVIQERKRPNDKLKNILIIRRHDPVDDPFVFLVQKYNVKPSNPETPIEDQIAWADLCITLGRGALESMAQGKPVLVADNRDYMGAIGDGYVTKDNIADIARCNFSGRAYWIPLTPEWIESELAKYNPEDSVFLHEYVKENHDAVKVMDQYLALVKPNHAETMPGLISVIIPAYNQQDMTYECIQHVIENTQNCEIILIDNGSDPPIQPPFSGFTECRVIRNEENKGFPVAMNQGLEAAKGEYIVLLNNDVTVSPEAINRLVEYLNEFDIVAPATNYCAGMQRVQLPSYNNLEDFYNEAESHYEASKGEVLEVNWVIGFMMAFKREVWEQIGDFDESLWPCSGEEIDFCYRAKDAGFKIAIAYDIYVHHEGSVTFKDMQSDGQLEYEKVCARNDAHIAEKWGKDFWNRQAISINDSALPMAGINLNLGCGYDYKKGYINIDNRAETNPDVVCDVVEGLPYPDSSVDQIRAHDFLEHIPIGKTITVMDEIWRVLKPGGTFYSSTPDAEYGQGAFQDPTHVSFWVENSWLYYTREQFRNLYGIKANFKIKSFERIHDDEARIVHLRIIAEAIK